VVQQTAAGTEVTRPADVLDNCDAAPTILWTKNGDTLGTGADLTYLFCLGEHPVTVTATDASGNSATASLVVTVTPVPVVIDIKPGEDPNMVNLGANGVLPVAILSTSDFDATQVDPTTVVLAGAGVAVRGRSSLASQKDVNDDGLVDLLVKVQIEDLAPEELEDGVAVLNAETYSGVSVTGSDEIIPPPPE
jgi:hypothetical protein